MSYPNTWFQAYTYIRIRSVWSDFRCYGSRRHNKNDKYGLNETETLGYVSRRLGVSGIYEQWYLLHTEFRKVNVFHK